MIIPVLIVQITKLQVERNEDGVYGLFVEVEVLGEKSRQQLMTPDGQPFTAGSPWELTQMAKAARKVLNIPED